MCYRPAPGLTLQAYQMMQKMRARNILYQPYLDVELTDSVYRAVGVEPEPEPVGNRGGPSQSLRPEDDDVIDDEVEED